MYKCWLKLEFMFRGFGDLDNTAAVATAKQLDEHYKLTILIIMNTKFESFYSKSTMSLSTFSGNYKDSPDPETSCISSI